MINVKTLYIPYSLNKKDVLLIQNINKLKIIDFKSKLISDKNTSKYLAEYVELLEVQGTKLEVNLIRKNH